MNPKPPCLHSTRRTFLKASGIAGASIAAQAMTSPVVGSAEGVSSAKRRIHDAKHSTEYMPNNRTALIVIDSYNDFLSTKGLTWPLVSLVANEENTVANLQAVVDVCRTADMLLAFAPHARYRGPGDFSDRRYLHPTQVAQLNSKIFSEGKHGGEFYPGLAPDAHDIVASEHQCSSGFAGTDLDKRLRENQITHLLMVGCISNTCVEATARSAVDLGYYVTVVTDAVAAFSPHDHAAAVDINFPLIINHTVTTAMLINDLS